MYLFYLQWKYGIKYFINLKIGIHPSSDFTFLGSKVLHMNYFFPVDVDWLLYCF